MTCSVKEQNRYKRNKAQSPVSTVIPIITTAKITRKWSYHVQTMKSQYYLSKNLILLWRTFFHSGSGFVCSKKAKTMCLDKYKYYPSRRNLAKGEVISHWLDHLPPDDVFSKRAKQVQKEQSTITSKHCHSHHYYHQDKEQMIMPCTDNLLTISSQQKSNPPLKNIFPFRF